MEKYFNSKGHMLAFALNELDGQSRMRVLGINMSLFTSSKKAKQWHDDILVELQQVGLDDIATVKKLDQLYKEML